MNNQKHGFTSKGSLKRLVQEYKYFRRKQWSLKEVGDFWDTMEGYDDINERLYPYFRRFTNSYELAARYLPNNDYSMLEIQARSGKGSLFWFEKRKIRSSVCVDFSDYLASLAEKRLKKSGLEYQCVKILDFPLPFEDETFNLVCSYETIEHICNYGTFFKELRRVMSDDGIMILTCPNVTWEWIHWLTAIFNINHSEGPHRFLRREELIKCFKNNNMEILEENSTIILPFNNRYFIACDKFLEKTLPQSIKSYLALRRTFVLRKGYYDC